MGDSHRTVEKPPLGELHRCQGMFALDYYWHHEPYRPGAITINPRMPAGNHAWIARASEGHCPCCGKRAAIHPDGDEAICDHCGLFFHVRTSDVRLDQDSGDFRTVICQVKVICGDHGFHEWGFGALPSV